MATSYCLIIPRSSDDSSSGELEHGNTNPVHKPGPAWQSHAPSTAYGRFRLERGMKFRLIVSDNHTLYAIDSESTETNHFGWLNGVRMQ